MRYFIDIHEVTGATRDAIAEAHQKDMECQDRYGVNYVKYWFNESGGKIFCLCTAPDAEAANAVHAHAHGLLAERIIEVDPDLVDGFLGQGAVAATGAATLPKSDTYDPGLRTILFTDIVGSTAITERLGDHAALQIVELHDRIVRDALGEHGGREVKHLGDGIMAAFTAAPAAVRSAAAIHAALGAEHAPEPVRVRIGLACGEPVERKGDFFGATVQLAARLCAQAQPGQTLVSTDVCTHCSDFEFSDLGTVLLKGFEQPVRAYAVI
ncbi:MAG TPA: nickel-binding protein [Candidatus Limnocylindrales bacterium]|nr:nickel-binding protein [Candidatus Limnocylindrales bacterium]